MSTTKKIRARRSTARKRTAQSPLERYRMEAKEIAAAKQAMERLHRGIEFQPERLHYVRSLQL